jgi:hypothetical protein
LWRWCPFWLCTTIGETLFMNLVKVALLQGPLAAPPQQGPDPIKVQAGEEGTILWTHGHSRTGRRPARGKGGGGRWAGSRGRGLRAEGRGHRAEGREPRAEGREPRAESREQRTAGQRAEGSGTGERTAGQRAENSRAQGKG